MSKVQRNMLWLHVGYGTIAEIPCQSKVSHGFGNLHMRSSMSGHPGTMADWRPHPTLRVLGRVLGGGEGKVAGSTHCVSTLSGCWHVVVACSVFQSSVFGAPNLGCVCESAFATSQNKKTMADYNPAFKKLDF